MIAFYDHKPSKLEAVGNGSYIYRWDIEKVENPVIDTGDPKEDAGFSSRDSWRCEEVTLWETPSNDNLKKAVISYYWDLSKEANIINNYNASQLGILTERSAIDEYRAYLERRKALKAMVDYDCEELGII